MAITERQQQLWGSLHAAIRNGGGWITSMPDASPIRFECPFGSDLPEGLANLGYKLRTHGTTEKLLPVAEVLSEHGRREKITRAK